MKKAQYDRLPEYLRIRVRSANRNATYEIKYGLTIEQVDQRIEDRGGLCDICHKPNTKRRLHVDHNHITGKVRGMLCSKCNAGLGMYLDSPELLRDAALYLEKHAA